MNASGSNQVESPGGEAVRPLWIGDVLVDPPVLQAPMAGFTDYAFRRLVRQYGGAGLLATEMVNASSFVRRPGELTASPPERLWGVREEPRPLAVQIWDNDPKMLAEAGGWLAHEYRVSVVDINFGCPVRRVAEKARSGSYLLQDPERMGRMIELVVRACRPTPVTAKIRLGRRRGEIRAGEVAEAVEAAGAAALTVHGRTAEDFFRGRADWDRISQVKHSLKRIPLIGNGDLDSAAKAAGAMRRYEVDGVMIGRAALGRPWLFRQAAAALRGQAPPPDPPLEQQRRCLLRHFELVAERYGEEKGVMLMRKYACRYASGVRGARSFRSRAARVRTAAEFREIVDAAFHLTQ